MSDPPSDAPTSNPPSDAPSDLSSDITTVGNSSMSYIPTTSPSDMLPTSEPGVSLVKDREFSSAVSATITSVGSITAVVACIAFC